LEGKTIVFIPLKENLYLETSRGFISVTFLTKNRRFGDEDVCCKYETPLLKTMSKSRFVKQSAKTAIIPIQATEVAALVTDLSAAMRGAPVLPSFAMAWRGLGNKS
jgi:hypothetical protein